MWDAAHSLAEIERERERFGREILPTLANIPVSRISKTTGLSIRYAAIVRAGKCTPHPVHYEALEQLLRTPGTSSPGGSQ